jgi:hypothetical protein
MSKKKGLDIDLNKLIGWCKSNLVLVILAVASIAAVVGLPRVAATWELEVEETLRERAKEFIKLDNLAGTRVTHPFKKEESAIVVVNQALIDAYTDATSAQSVVAKEVVKQANQHNHKEDLRHRFDSTLFGDPTRTQLEELPELFHRELELKYKQLLELAKAGTAATNEDLASSLEDARVEFMVTNLSTKQDADLTKEQRTNLENHLAERRLLLLQSHATDISIYLDEATLNIPVFSFDPTPSPGELFTWQWRYWAVADIVRAIAAINADNTEITSLIKRVVTIDIVGLPVPIEDANVDGGSRPPSGSNPPRPGGMPPRPAGPTGGPGPMGGPTGGPTGTPPRPSPSGGRPPSGGSNAGMSPSHTGQTSGELYDLLQVRLSLVVNTERIPRVLDSFASHNFLTVIDLELRPIDKFVAMGAGYEYGVAPVSLMTIVLEAAWLRSWTVESMPDSVKRALGIKTDG